jgi:ABC-type molybdate transport system permease subunit
MGLIMIVYYLLSLYIAVFLGWNFVREKKSVNDMILYLLVLIPLILRILRVK